MYDIVGAIKSGFDAFTAWMGFKSKKLDLNNAANVQAAAAAQKEVDAQDKTAKAIADKNLDALRKEGAE